MLLGDIGETLHLAAERRLAEARMRLFHPLGFMLASPAESAEDALSYFQNAWVEDKYDGIRAQAHCSGDTVRFFSRTRDEITESFPELPEAFAGLPQDAILDGEIVAWSYLMGEQDESGRALPFNALQQRLGRKRVSEKLMREVPVTYLVFDVLYAGSELLIDRPQRERTTILNELLAAKRTPNHEGHQVSRKTTQSRLSFETDLPAFATQIVRAPAFGASSPQELDQLFDAAQARGNEGLMIKDPESPYTPGRRGKSWLKLKRELAMLDVVVTAAEYGHGKRIGVLSDYTFAIRDGDRLRNIGKAYSGLTDTEIAEMTKWFLGHTIEDQGFRRIVEPKIVLEVAFNNIMKSDRHNSGYALRFPRIVRLRQDKLPEEADTMERVEEIYKGQSRGRSNYRTEAMNENKYSLVNSPRDARFLTLRSIQTPPGRIRSGLYLIEGIRHVARAVSVMPLFTRFSLSRQFCRTALAKSSHGGSGDQACPAFVSRRSSTVNSRSRQNGKGSAQCSNSIGLRWAIFACPAIPFGSRLSQSTLPEIWGRSSVLLRLLALPEFLCWV